MIFRLAKDLFSCQPDYFIKYWILKNAVDKRLFYLVIFLITLLVLWVSFGNIGGLTVRLYDEARLANNALEMYHHKNYWVTSFSNEPDMWNTKPPLMTWLQVCSFHLFGINDIALRLPSALAVAGTFITVFHFCYKRLQHFWLACLSVAVLSATKGYIIDHVALTGDYDALLILWTVLACSVCFAYTETGKKRTLYLTFVLLGLAVLTKGIAGLFFTPALLLWTIFRKRLRYLLTSIHTYTGLLVFFLIALSYYFIREQFNPGYIQAVLDNELGGRFLQTLENHKHPWYWYLENMYHEKFIPWMFLLPIGICSVFFEKNPLLKRGILFVLVLSLSFLSMLAFSQTKLFWYEAPVYPLLAILAGYSLYSVFSWILKIKKSVLRYTIFCAALLVVSLIIVFKIRKILYPADDPTVQMAGMAYFIRDHYLEGNESYPLIVLYSGYQPHIEWYMELAKIRGAKAVLRKNTDKLLIGDKVAIYTKEGKEFNDVQTHYRYTIICRSSTVLFVQITGHRPDFSLSD